MIELYNLGLSETEIYEMLYTYPELKEISNEEILNNIELLNSIGCNNKQIKNILVSNPFYLNRMIEDISNLINQMIKYGITNINFLFDSNPYLLNKDADEIEEYVIQEQNKGRKIEDIIDEFESNPYIIDEI